VSEVDISTGSSLRDVSSPSYQLNGGLHLVIAGPDLFVASSDGGSLSEVDTSTGALVRLLSGLK
jgi:hypothetical protein